MKKTLVIALFLVFAVVGTASAQTTDLPAPGSVPGSPFYFLDRFFEGVGTFFTFGNSAKAERYLALAEERLAEARALAEQGNERAQDAIADFEEQVADAKERAEQAGDFDLEERVTDATTKHLSVLDEVLERVPEQAKASIAAAKERSMRGQIEALRGIAGRDPEAAVDIFSRAAEGRLRAAEARANGQGGDGEEAEDVEELLEEFNEYAEFGKEISALAEGLQTGETTVKELIQRATSHHMDILKNVQQNVPTEAQDGIQKAMDNADRVRDQRPAIQSRDGNVPPPVLQQQGAPEGTGADSAPVDTDQFIPSQAGQNGGGAEEENGAGDAAEGVEDAGGPPSGIPGGRP